MAQRWDGQKRREWEDRLARFRSSEQTVGRFCASEKVSVNTFYYWAKRIPAHVIERQRSGRDGVDAGRRRAKAVTMSDRSLATRSSSGATSTLADNALVHFQWNSGLRVSIPADCLDAIRCVVQCVQDSSRGLHDAFHQILIDPR